MQPQKIETLRDVLTSLLRPHCLTRHGTGQHKNDRPLRRATAVWQ